jgi:hypothetical protein
MAVLILPMLDVNWVRRMVNLEFGGVFGFREVEHVFFS